MKVYYERKGEIKRCCCNCIHDARLGDVGNTENYCEIDDHYIGYVECFEGWCPHWASDENE